jgi:hypothetical protein
MNWFVKTESLRIVRVGWLIRDKRRLWRSIGALLVSTE